MMQLRSSSTSFVLGLLALACSNSDNSGPEAMTSEPSGSTTTSSAAPTSGTGGVSPTTTGPTGGTQTGVAPVGPTGTGVSPTSTSSNTTAVGPSGSTAPTTTATGSTATVSPTSDAVSPTGSTPGETTSAPVEPIPDVPEPSLVVSSQDNYWQVGEVTSVDAGTANFTVTSATEHQEWHGWGGTFNEAGWDALQVLSAEDRAHAIQLLFSETDGLGLDWGRIPIGPSDYALERYHLSDAPGQFDISHDETTLIPFIKAAQAVKNNVIYWASPWTPPPWAKTGGENGGYDKGAFNPEYYEEYADFFISWIKAYETAGIPIDSVMPQNEPGWAQSYPTCRWGPARDSTDNIDLGVGETITLGTFVDGHLFPAIDAAGLQTKVWFGTLSNNTFFPNYWNDMKSKPNASRLVGVALQWETIAQVESLVSDGLVVMQSEHRCGNYPWGKDTSIPDYITHQLDQKPTELAPNDFNYGQESWVLFSDWIKRGVNIYSAWNMVLDTHGTNLDERRVWNQNALLVVDRDTNMLKVTPYYYVFRHLTQYVDVNAKRVEISGDALAFKNPDGSIVAVMRTAAPGNQIVSIDGTLLQFAATGNGWVTVNWKPQ